MAFVAEEDEIEFEIRLLELEHKLVELSMEIQRIKKPLPFLEDELEMEPEIGLGEIDEVDVNGILQRLNTRWEEYISDPNEIDSDEEKDNTSNLLLISSPAGGEFETLLIAHASVNDF